MCQAFGQRSIRAIIKLNKVIMPTIYSLKILYNYTIFSEKFIVKNYVVIILHASQNEVCKNLR